MEEKTKIPQKLNEQEEKEVRDGMAIYEMAKTSVGWQIVKGMLEDMAFHSWVDPRGMDKKEWEFAELNAFHAANNAKEILENINKIVSRSEYLQKIKSGEIDRRSMRI
jgi:hypothetical protein